MLHMYPYAPHSDTARIRSASVVPASRPFALTEWQLHEPDISAAERDSSLTSPKISLHSFQLLGKRPPC